MKLLLVGLILSGCTTTKASLNACHSKEEFECFCSVNPDTIPCKASTPADACLNDEGDLMSESVEAVFAANPGVPSCESRGPDDNKCIDDDTGEILEGI